jgi:hypothetical protein
MGGSLKTKMGFENNLIGGPGYSILVTANIGFFVIPIGLLLLLSEWDIVPGHADRATVLR